MSEVLVPIAVGELVDKLTILNIKLRMIKDPAKLQHVRTEHAALISVCQRQGIDLTTALVHQLEDINWQLWQVEDDIRDKERAKTFDADFIALARSVYRINDQRAQVKAQINAATGSLLQEAKSYRDYQ